MHKYDTMETSPAPPLFSVFQAFVGARCALRISTEETVKQTTGVFRPPLFYPRAMREECVFVCALLIAMAQWSRR